MRKQVEEQPDPVRRGLLTGRLMTQQGREKVKRLQQPLGVPIPRFHQIVDNCTLCEQECISACSQNIIQLHPDGHAYAGTPWLDFSRTGCTFCGDCAEVCPSIDDDQDTSPVLRHLQLAETRCLAWNNVLCMSCVGNCGVRALRLDEQRRVVLNESLCTGCGMCIHACPVNALATHCEG